MSKNKGHVLIAIVAVLLIVSGLCCIAYPFAREGYENYMQQKLLQEWDRIQYEDHLEAYEPVADTGRDENANDADGWETRYPVVGTLVIDSIELCQPIIKEATDEHLRYSVCTVEPTTYPDEVGNFVIAGHNSWTYGRLFSRLSEVKVGDSIVVELSEKEQVSYSVSEIVIIEESDTWILEKKEDNATITLLTCYYADDGTTKRLAVIGVKDTK